MSISSEKIAQVKVENKTEKVNVFVSSDDKPQIDVETISNWQEIINLISEVISVPAGLIMKIAEKQIEVFLSSDGEKNPYKVNEKADLGMGLYCETVIGTNKQLLVPNALKEDYWKENPDIELDMISYLGLPLRWSDGEVFGTICVLDSKENEYSETYTKLLKQFQAVIEHDLHTILQVHELKQQNSYKQLQMVEERHRMKNQLNLLFSMIHLKSSEIKSKNTKIVLDDLAGHVKSISLLHNKLNISLNGGRINLCSYINDLFSELLSDLTTIKFDGKCNREIMLLSKDLINCGLIITELVTNSKKYAFKNTKTPKISLQVEPIDKDMIKLIYHDNGKGFPADFDPEEVESLGIKIIQGLVDQLHGKVTFTNKQGAYVKMTLMVNA